MLENYLMPIIPLLSLLIYCLFLSYTHFPRKLSAYYLFMEIGCVMNIFFTRVEITQFVCHPFGNSAFHSNCVTKAWCTFRKILRNRDSFKFRRDEKSKRYNRFNGNNIHIFERLLSAYSHSVHEGTLFTILTIFAKSQ